MRISIRLSFLFLVSVILVSIILDMAGNNIRKNETNSLANTAAYQSVLATNDKTYPIENEQDMITELIKDIVLNKETNSDIKVQILGIDHENGMIDINVIQTVHHSNGVDSTIEERRTVILNNEPN